MKLHLPVLLRKALLACFAFAFACSATSAAADLTLGGDASLTIDYAAADSFPDLEGGTLTLNGDAILLLSNCGVGDGKTYTLATGISELLDAEGNAITLDSTNNAISKYFDVTQPGTGFWAGSALVLTADGTLQLVRHNETVTAAETITTRQTGGAVYQYYAGVSFENIEYSSSSSASGGAFDGWSSTITLSGNGSVTFSGNTASGSNGGYGGAIYGLSSTITLSGNGSVTFSGNTASSFGGAIYGNWDSTITLSDNGSVTFSGNTASGSSGGYGHGGAIHGNSGSTITLSDNGSVTFSGNTASYCGGAIDGSTITLSNNGSVTFSGNTASGSNGGYGFGGAIFGSRSTITLSNNGSVEFVGNTASASSYAHGGAICGLSTITLSDNGSVTFSGNTASLFGGAIHVSGEDAGFYITGNALGTNEDGSLQQVLFENNGVKGEDVCGGAIMAGVSAALVINNNGEVVFKGNYAQDDSYFSAHTSGGAICKQYGIFSIQNNASVIFEGNYTLNKDGVRLQSIYAYDKSGLDGKMVVNFSAPEGGKIEFRDSIDITVYWSSSSALRINAQYENEPGTLIAQTGDVIFTGAYATRETLTDILEKHDRWIVTDAEIENSKHSTFCGVAQLYDGRLIIRDGAVIDAYGINVNASASGESTPTLMLHHGTLTSYADQQYATNAVTIAGGGSLSLAGQNEMRFSSLTLSGGSSLIVNVDNTHTTSAALTLNSSTLTISGELMLKLNAAAGITDGQTFALLTGVSQPTNWTSTNITVTSGTAGWDVSFDDLSWIGDTLWLYYDSRPDLVTATWTNETADSKWNTTSLNWEQDEIDYEYKDGVAVVFGDEGAGTVTLVGDIVPKTVLVDSTQDYTWVADATEGGKLTGSMKLTKQGTGTLHIKTSNDYTGGTEIKGGTVVAGTASALGTGAVLLNGGTLEIGAAGVANVISNAGSSTLQTSAGVTHDLTGIISNSGTLALSGSFDASRLTYETLTSDERYALDGSVVGADKSGFAVGEKYSVQIVNGGTVAPAAGVTILHDMHSGRKHELVLGTDGYARANGDGNYSHYYLTNGDAVSVGEIADVSAIEGDALTLVTMDNGTLTVDQSITVNATGGTINMQQDTLSGTWTNATVNATGGSLAGSFAGTSTLEGSNGFNLGSTAVQNTGTLTLKGSFDASGMTSVATGVDMRVDDKDIVTQDGSGFLRTGDFEVLVATGTVDSTDADVTYGGQTLTMTDGTGFGVGTVQYDTYLLKGSDTATVSRIATMAGEALQKIDMQGGTLNVDASTDKLVATGGSIQLSAGTLGGSIGGTAAVAVSGTATMSGNNSYTGGTALSNGNLTITHAKALGTGSISAEGTSSLTVGSGVTLALGSVISNSGTLALSGSIDASALAKSESDDIYVALNGVEDKNGSGFLRSGDFSVLVVNGSTVGSTAATITWHGTTLDMTGGTGFAAGAMHYDTYRILSGHAADALAIHQHHADSANAKVALAAGGTLNANDANGVEVTANGGTINLTAGALVGTWTDATVNATGGSLAGRFAGASTLVGTQFNLGSTAVQNDGTLELRGSFDASGMASVATGVNMRVDEDGIVSQDGSGFLRMGDFTVLVAGGTVDSTNTTVTYGGQTLSMTGGTGFGVGTVQYDTYLLKGDDTATVSKIVTMAGEALQKIDMQGGTLHVNASTDKLVATGGNIQLSAGTLGGSIGGTSAVAVSGTATISGNNSYTGGTTLSNGNLTITHANALGNAIVSSTGSSSLVVGNGVTLALGSVISNNGTLELCGSFDASALSKSASDDIYVAVDGTEDKNGSGFLRSGDFTVLVVDGGTVDATAATITWHGTTLEMMSGTGFASGAVDYGSYHILSDHTADALAIHQFHAASANAKVTLAAGGTLNANDTNGVDVTANGGTINLTAGALVGTWTDATVNATGGSLAGRFAGASTLVGTQFNLGSTAVQNDGTLELRGSFDASGMASILTNVNMRVDEDGVVSQDGSGFLRTGDFTVLVAGGTVDSTNATVTYGSQTLSMTGGTGFGVGTVQYDTYLLKGDDTATVSKIATMAGDALQKIDMQGGTLHVNASTDKLVATGGNIQLSAGTLGGSIGGTAAVAVNGTATISGNNSYTGGTTLSNGNLTITHANALGNAIVSSTGSSSLVVGNGVTLVLDKVIGNTGTLALSGSFDASALLLNKTEAGRLSLSGERVGLTESGFSQGVEYTVLIVDGGSTVNAGAGISHKDYLSRTQLVLGEDGVARAGAEVDYTHYFLTGGDSAVVSKIAEVSTWNQAELNGVTMDSGLLTVDQSITVSATGGSIVLTKAATLGGSIENTAVSSSAGNYSATISALMSGDSALVVNGGEITVSAANSYTGGTQVNGGALMAGNAKAFGTGDVVVNGSTLDLNRFSITNKVVMNGSSTLGNADGASHIVLGSGAAVNFRNGYTLGSGKRLTVAGPASYTGALTLGGGTLELSGLLTVRGDVEFVNGATTTLDISGWKGLDDGDVLVDFGSSNSGYADGSLSLEGIAGDWELAFDAATGVLTLVAVKDEPMPEPEPEPMPEPEFAPELNRNQQVVYDTVKDIMGEGKPSGLLGQLGKEVTDTRDEAKLKELLDALGGAEYATLMSSQQDAARGHMRRLRGSMGSGHALAGTNARAYIEAYTNRADVDGDSSGRGYEMTENGGQFVLEFIGEENVSGGLAVASGRTKLQPDGGLSQKGDNTYVDAFLVCREGGYTGKISLGVGVYSYDLERNVMGNAVSAQTDGSSVNFMHESAYEVAVDEVNSVQFFGAVESSMGKLGAFHEKGADTASLQVKSQDAWMTTLSAGARYHYSFAAVDAAPAATLSLQAGLEYKLGDTESEVEMNFSGARSHAFRQSGSKRDSFGYNVGARLHVPVSARAAVYASGDAVLRGDSREVNANVGIQLAF